MKKNCSNCFYGDDRIPYCPFTSVEWDTAGDCPNWQEHPSQTIANIKEEHEAELEAMQEYTDLLEFLFTEQKND